MTMQQPRRKTEPYRWAALCGTLACALAWGLVEFLALQRSRYHLRRERQQTPAHH
ncbi:hypothetical protein [Acidovorax sp. 69]|uniref:hypothetical protein n=1 Tax=Acidovorax sp. 69 TaxID=2035202 RepID=UPI0018E214D4|nr:hypothetical protein [Acidovorax sp. 69]